MGVSETERFQQAERRNLISSAFISLLLALAFGEAVSPVRESVRSDGLTLGTAILFGVFFLTITRWFIGAILHLVSPQLVSMPGRVWFFDFVAITIESLVLIFMGGTATIAQSRASPGGFLGLLVALLAIDAVWVAGQWLLQRLFPSFKRPSIPWAWAVLNTSVIVAVLVPMLWVSDLYSTGMLVWLGVLGVGAFVVDVILVDYHNMI